MYFSDHCYVSSTKHRNLHRACMASWNWFFTDLRSPDVENLEVHSCRLSFRRLQYDFQIKFTIFFFFPRISVIFRVRSAKAVKITDMNLLKRVGMIVTIFSALLGIRTLVAPPIVIVARTADDLKAFLCRTDWWDHSFTIRKNSFFLYLKN